MRDHDLTDEEIAAIQAESKAYDLAHPYWREEAKARQEARWKAQTAQAKTRPVALDIQQRMAALQARLQKGKP